MSRHARFPTIFAAIMLILTALRATADTDTDTDTASDPVELWRTWQSSAVYVPTSLGTSRQISVTALPDYLAQHQNSKIVLYAHGCSGIVNIGHAAGKFYARNGFVFVAPDSFARRSKPDSCNPTRYQGGLHRRVLAWRHAEITYALTRLRALPGLANAPIALIGHSEGGIAVATYQGAPVSLRVIEGWTCHAGWPEYDGLNAPTNEPVLSLIAKDDPWYKLPVLQGDCGPFMDSNDRSVVFRRPDRLHNKHWLSKSPRVRKIILAFLARHL